MVYVFLNFLTRNMLMEEVSVSCLAWFAWKKN